MWMLGGEPAPYYDALNRFRSKHLSEAIEELFYQFRTGLQLFEKMTA